MKKGFTLIELLVAATIITVLVSIGIVSYGSVNRRSRDTKRKSDIEQIRSALEMYRADVGWYPYQTDWVDAGSLGSSLVPDYMPAIPTDPKALGYSYLPTNLNVSNNHYYGYCLSACLESETPSSNPCTPYACTTGSGYAAKNP